MLSLRFICKAPITHYNTLRRAGSISLSSKGYRSMGLPRGEGNCAVSRRSLELEGGQVLRSMGLALLVLLSVAGGAQAQSWAEKMFPVTDHNFGTVARGADTFYKFEVTNPYKQDMTLTGVRSSCGCTSPTLETADGKAPENGQIVLKSHEKAYVMARFNTRTHVGQKGATLTVSLGGQYGGEVQLHVSGNIRSDVVFNPGAIEFGEVNEGEAKEQRVTVNYAGRSDWEIVDVTNDNDNFEVELLEANRTGGKISYDLVVRLKNNLPAGYVKDQLTVVTNDNRAENQRIPLIVSGNVRPEFSVTPAQLALGEIQPGAHVTKKIAVRGKEPFKIVDVNCGEDCFGFKTDSEEARKIHFVDVTFTAGEAPGKLQTPIQIVTDRDNRGATCVASATVVAETVEAPAAAAAAIDDDAVRTVSAQ
ncbi:hypothetical protein PLANPX_0884 [Lacipirellula parvula]|uniref:DUF1573 domain-containing protein n=2 Tax=Lacipirellula parvula TaxID=2650471 RepID=A0A5K7X641_9BACT|nr:hypothetical protein PLANPX_0884 [Lacipirellula parvula]